MPGILLTTKRAIHQQENSEIQSETVNDPTVWARFSLRCCYGTGTAVPAARLPYFHCQRLHLACSTTSPKRNLELGQQEHSTYCDVKCQSQFKYWPKHLTAVTSSEGQVSTLVHVVTAMFVSCERGRRVLSNDAHIQLR